MHMSNGDEAERCDFCGKGHVVRTVQEMALHQWTDKGYVFCRVAIPLGVCDRCGLRTWYEEADKIIEEGVRREYDKLP